jgi:hypothetical protein
MKNWFSVRFLYESFVATLRRFPFALFYAASGFLIYDYLNYRIEHPKELEHLGLCAVLGISLSIGLTLVSESLPAKKSPIRFLLQPAGVLLLALYYLEIRTKTYSWVYFQYAQFCVSSHLFVAIAWFLKDRDTVAFWRFNQILLSRFSVALLFSSTLFLGSAAILFSTEQLFGIKMSHREYFDLWLFAVLIFHPIFFLSGVPTNRDDLKQLHTFPKLLRVFSQYLLLPLVTLYSIVLYAYLAKIILQGVLPKGMVSNLIWPYACVGILSLLLVHPLRNDETQPWIKNFSKVFYFALYPLLALMAVAIGTRIHEYGVTESRYFMTLICLWLIGIASYFNFSKTKDIRLIPYSLFILGLLTSFGPWGSLRVSERSQHSRLQSFLQSYHLIANGKIQTLADPKVEFDTDALKPAKMNFEDNKEISSIVAYLFSRHGFESLEKYIPENWVKEIKEKYDGRSQASTLLQKMGLSFVNSWENKDPKSFWFFFAVDDTQQPAILSTKTFDFLIDLPHLFFLSSAPISNNPKIPKSIVKDDVSFSFEPQALIVSCKQSEPIRIDLAQIVRGLNEKFSSSPHQPRLSPETLEYKFENSSMRLKLELSELSGKWENEKPSDVRVSGRIWVKLK